MTGTFKIWHGKEHGAIYSRWIKFAYRIENGVTEIKGLGNRFANWTVGSIPDGAIIISKK